MIDYPDFDLASTPLAPGLIMLEASAGTGKTYSITGIAARLIAIEEIPIREILLVTFTEAATHELRDRVRRRLTEIALALEGEVSKDPVVAAIRKSGVDLKEATKRLAIAVASFDEASISTIHGFCQSLLRDNAFESGASFETEVVTDPRDLLLELAMDFWRKHFTQASNLSGALAEHIKPTKRRQTIPETLAELLGRLGRQPDIIILPEKSEPFEIAQDNAEAAYQAALSSWMVNRDDLVEILEKDKGISRNQKTGLPVYKAKEFIQSLDYAVETHIPTQESVEALVDLSQDKLNTMELKKYPLPRHSFFELCRDFGQTVTPWKQALHRKWLDFAAVEFPRMKEQRRVMTFDDMLTQVRDTLRGPRGVDLANSVGSRFQAALIDEFQDTDPLQYEIFERIFSRPEHRLMLIGDPKQSIFGFRGADLFTYLKAKQTIHKSSTPQIYTLRQNYRSETGLVEAANTLFSISKDCFFQGGVDFFPSVARSEEEQTIRFSGPSQSAIKPLQIVRLPSSNPADPKKKLNKTDAQSIIYRDLVGKIKELVDGDYLLGEERVGPGDIAVLVRDRFQAADIHKGLSEAGIPNVRHTEDSVFKTDEAKDLLRVFSAILEPTRERLLKAALATCFFGLDAKELFDLESDEVAWDARIEAFIALRKLWGNFGFMKAFRQLAVEVHLRSSLVKQKGGERILTNMLHLAELVHEAERELRLTPAGLIQWIRHQHEEEQSPPKSQFLRLERDDDSVQIVTVHKSKGLQYGIVFCPFHWIGGNARETIFHDPDNDNRLTLDLSKSPEGTFEELANKEVWAEGIRLLYVGLTRAVHRCFLYWSDARYPETSSLGHVLGQEDDALDRLVKADPQNIGLSNPEYPEEMPASDSKSSIVELELDCRTLDKKVPQESMVASFSGLTHSSSIGPVDRPGDPKDRDDAAIQSLSWKKPPSAADYSIFTLPKGASAGNVLHSVLEDVDFTEPNNLEELVETALGDEGMNIDYTSTISKQLKQLFIHPLGAGDVTVRLSDVSQGDRLSEAEFFYPIRRFWPSDLTQAYQALNIPKLPEQIDRLRFNPTDGYLLGFIDLIFRHNGRYYIADWKSNWLGDTSADYTPEKLEAAMIESSYHLQSHLYAVALDLYLASRIPDYSFSQHFGGIFYIFVRGIDPELPDNGVHFESTDQEFLELLKQKILV